MPRKLALVGALLLVSVTGWHDHFDVEWVDSTACANLLHAGASVHEASTALTKCLVDMVKQSDADLEDPEEVLLGAAREAMMREGVSEGAYIEGPSGSDARADQAERVPADASSRERHERERAAAAATGTDPHGTTSGGSGPEAELSGGRRARSASEAWQQRLDDEGVGRPDARAAGTPARAAGHSTHGGGGGGGGAAAMPAAHASGVSSTSISMQDCFVFYVSVAGLAAFFTRSICSYIVSWWPVFEIGLLALALVCECAVLLRYQRAGASAASVEGVTNLLRKGYVLTNLLALVGCVMYCWAEPFLRLLQSGEAPDAREAAAAEAATPQTSKRGGAPNALPRSTSAGSDSAGSVGPSLGPLSDRRMSDVEPREREAELERLLQAQKSAAKAERAARVASEKELAEAERRLAQEQASRKRLEAEHRALAERGALARTPSSAEPSGGRAAKRMQQDASTQTRADAHKAGSSDAKRAGVSVQTQTRPARSGAGAANTAPAEAQALASQLSEAKQVIHALQSQLQALKQQQLHPQHHHHQMAAAPAPPAPPGAPQQAQQRHGNGGRRAPSSDLRHNGVQQQSSGAMCAGAETAEPSLLGPYGGGRVPNPGGIFRASDTSQPEHWEALRRHADAAHHARSSGPASPAIGNGRQQAQPARPIGVPAGVSASQQAHNSSHVQLSTSGAAGLSGSAFDGPPPGSKGADESRELLGPPLDFDFSFIEEDLAEEDKNVLRLVMPGATKM